MELFILIIGLVIGCLLCYFVLKPKLKTVNNYNENIRIENNDLLTRKSELEKEINKLISERNCLSTAIAVYSTQKQEIANSIQELRHQAYEDNEIIYQQGFELMQEKLSHAAEEEALKFQNAQEYATQEYLTILAEMSQETAEALASKSVELAAINEQLNTMRAQADAAIAAARREEEKALAIDKYKILISDLDLLEINRLREIAPYFRNPRAIYKIIWESYYRNLTTDMINRVIGSGIHTGIYKLTNLKNQKTYIGQAINISDRWKEHIKCGLGIDTPSNILYSAMIAEGVENFTFEIVEKCPREELNAKEAYWINFYQSNIYGYNMTKGNK